MFTREITKVQKTAQLRQNVHLGHYLMHHSKSIRSELGEKIGLGAKNEDVFAHVEARLARASEESERRKTRNDETRRRERQQARAKRRSEAEKKQAAAQRESELLIKEVGWKKYLTKNEGRRDAAALVGEAGKALTKAGDDDSRPDLVFMERLVGFSVHARNIVFPLRVIPFDQDEQVKNYRKLQVGTGFMWLRPKY